MALLTKRELSEAKTYLLSRIGNDDLTELELRAVVGVLKLSKSQFWQNSFVTELLHEYLSGERNSPQRVMLLLAESIGSIESVAPGSKLYYKLTGKRPVKAPETPAAGTGGEEVLP